MSEELLQIIHSDLKEIKVVMKEFTTSQANQDTRLALLEKETIDLDKTVKDNDKTLHARISKHVDNHWRWILAIAGLLALAEAIRKYLQ